MIPGQKILCLCSHGNSRSVALAYLLKEQHYEAIALGINVSSELTIKMLAEWADHIILTVASLEVALLAKVPGVVNKLLIWDVGEDVFFRGFDGKLLRFYRDQIDAPKRHAIME